MSSPALVFQVGNVRSEQLPSFHSGCTMAVYFGPHEVSQAACQAFHESLPKFVLAVASTYMGTPYKIRQGHHAAGESYGLVVECPVYNITPGAVRRSQRFYAAMKQLAEASVELPAPAREEARISLLEGEVDGVARVEITAVLPPLILAGIARIIDITEQGAILSDVLVHEPLRRQGIGTQMVRAAKQWTDQRDLDLYLHVRPDNPALQLYLAEGFEDFYGQQTEEGSLWMVSVANEGRLVREKVPDG